jgi:uroporphyrinogen-III synthase
LRILVTRPQPGAADTALALRARGHAPIVAPLSEIEILSEVDPKSGPWTAIVLTSANGLHGIASPAWREKWHSVPVFAVGDASAKAARAMGLDVTSAAGDVVVVYRLVAAQSLPEPAAAALVGEIDGVLHFSRQSAAAFLAAARNSNLLGAALTKPVHFCLSAQVAGPLREAGAAKIRVAEQPNENALLELCG